MRDGGRERLRERKGGGEGPLLSTWKQHLQHQLKPAKRSLAAPSFQRWVWKGVGDALLSLYLRQQPPIILKPTTNSKEEKRTEMSYFYHKKNDVFHRWNFIILKIFLITNPILLFMDSISTAMAIQCICIPYIAVFTVTV